MKVIINIDGSKLIDKKASEEDKQIFFGLKLCTLTGIIELVSTKFPERFCKWFDLPINTRVIEATILAERNKERFEKLLKAIIHGSKIAEQRITKSILNNLKKGA